MRRTIRTTLAALAALLCAAAPAAAQQPNLVTNGSFEAPNGWQAGWAYETLSPGWQVAPITGDCAPTMGAGPVCLAFTPAAGATGEASIRQQLTTTAGTPYLASFLYRLAGTGATDFAAFLRVDGATVTSTCTGFALCTLELAFVASGATADLTLGVTRSTASGATGQEIVLVDAVSVASTVPEPATVALVGGGLLGLAGVARRRRA